MFGRSTFMAMTLLCSSLALAQTVILNPGDVNNFGVQLSCQPNNGGGVYPPAPTPPPPPAPVPVYAGRREERPNESCLEGIAPADPKSVSREIDNCPKIARGPDRCDSQQNVDSRLDNGCYQKLLKKELLPAAVHPDQGRQLVDACSEVSYDCYVLR